MEYAIIQLNGKQYRVSMGDTLVVDRIDGDTLGKNGSLKIEKVLLVRNATETKIGMPFVNGAVVELKHVNDQKGEKIDVLKYKSKSRYRRSMGFRAHQSVFTVASIAA